jgi:formyltetrahydrofolate synthetase
VCNHLLVYAIRTRRHIPEDDILHYGNIFAKIKVEKSAIICHHEKHQNLVLYGADITPTLKVRAASILMPSVVLRL